MPRAINVLPSRLIFAPIPHFAFHFTQQISRASMTDDVFRLQSDALEESSAGSAPDPAKQSNTSTARGRTLDGQPHRHDRELRGQRQPRHIASPYPTQRGLAPSPAAGDSAFQATHQNDPPATQGLQSPSAFFKNNEGHSYHEMQTTEWELSAAVETQRAFYAQIAPSISGTTDLAGVAYATVWTPWYGGTDGWPSHLRSRWHPISRSGRWRIKLEL